jgi:hypothetical protein
MKFVEPSHFTDPDATARKLLEIANATEPAQDGRLALATHRLVWTGACYHRRARGGPLVTYIRNRRAATAPCGFTIMPDGLVNTIAASI